MKRLGPVALSGFSAAVAQVLLSRELMVAFRGNEMSLGLVLACWSAAMAVGSLLVTRWRPAAALALEHTQIALVPALLASLSLARTARPVLGLETGEIPGPGAMLVASLLALLPASMIIGAQFPVACRDRPVTAAYVAEAGGGVAGGLVVSLLLLPHLRPLTMVMLLCAANLLAAGLGTLPRPRVVAWTCLAALLVMAPLSPRADDALTRARWHGENVVTWTDSRYANIVVTDRRGQHSFYVSGTLAFTLPDPDIARVERAALLPLLAHPDPASMLLIGGGLSGNLEAAARHPGLCVLGVELDPTIPRLASGLGAEVPPGTRLAYGDARKLLTGWDGDYDVVVVDLPGPSTLYLNRFYTAEFFEAVGRILSPGGVVGVVWPLPDTKVHPEHARLTWTVLAAAAGAGGEAILVPGQPGIILAGPGISPPLDPGVLSARGLDRGLSSPVLTPPYLSFVLDRRQVEHTMALLGPDPGDVANRDLIPRAVYHYLALFGSQFSPAGLKVYEWLAALSRLWFLWPLPVFVLGLRAARRGTPHSLTVGVAGFSGIVLSLGLLLAYQSLVGYAYERMGLMYGGFMAGLALGGLHAARRPGGLGRAPLALGVYSLLLAAVLPLMAKAARGPALELALAAAVVVAGYLEGRVFAVAVRSGGSGGNLWTADLLGMASGAALAGTVLLPAVGHSAAFAAVGLVNLGLAASRVLARATAGRQEMGAGR